MDYDLEARAALGTRFKYSALCTRSGLANSCSAVVVSGHCTKIIQQLLTMEGHFVGGVPYFSCWLQLSLILWPHCSSLFLFEPKVFFQFVSWLVLMTQCSIFIIGNSERFTITGI